MSSTSSPAPSPTDPSSSDSPAESPSLDEARTQGQEDGRDGLLDTGAYESYLALSVARDRIQEALDDLQEELDQVTSSLDDVHTLRQNLKASAAALEELESQRDETTQDLEDVETTIEAIEEKQSANKNRGSLLYAVLYTIAGMLFVAGDVIMSREIVASALKIQGEVESWIFALGLAMMAVLLKPAYDRLVERRYWKGRSHVFAGVISVCALGALSTLWILGAFRSSAFANSTRIRRLTAKLTETSDPAAIQDIQSTISRLQQDLIEDPLAYWAFALSGVLFAVAGAVCLGIGFGHIRDAYHLRYQLHRAYRRFADKRDTLTDTLDTLNRKIRETRVEMAEQRQALNDAESIDALEDRRDDLQARRRTLRNERAELHSRCLQSLYRRSVLRARSANDDPPSGDGAPSLRPDQSAPDDDASYIGIQNLLPRSS